MQPWLDHEVGGVQLTNVELDRALADEIRAIAARTGCWAEILLPAALSAGLAVLLANERAFVTALEAGRAKGVSQ